MTTARIWRLRDWRLWLMDRLGKALGIHFNVGELPYGAAWQGECDPWP